jgi:hypothetical protein
MPLRSRVVWFLVVAALTMLLTPPAGAQTRVAGELVWAWHVTIAPSWFDPGEVPAQITPFSLIYAMHDAVVRAMPRERMGNSLAESWPDFMTFYGTTATAAGWVVPINTSSPLHRFPCTPARRWRTCDSKSHDSDGPVVAAVGLGQAFNLTT